MGLFNIFKSKPNQTTASTQSVKAAQGIQRTKARYADSRSIAPDERPYYQPDEYYTMESYPGTDMAVRVITFEERKRTSCPTSNGLYVAEVMLLEYCSHGKYPKPKSGYPGLWWFEFGIRDVGHALESLENRGFLQWAPMGKCLKSFKVDELKSVLQKANISTSGKKADLIARIIENVPEEDWGVESNSRKYELTELGKTELENNGYIPYMVRHPRATTEEGRFGDTFNVWDMNKLFRDGHAENWRAVIGKIEKQRFGFDMVNMQKEEPEKNGAKDSAAAVKNNSPEKRQEIRAFLASKQNVINRSIRTRGDGFDEEMQGIALKSAGNDKEALVQFYISIGKHFEAPALYNHAAIILRKYGMYEEELDVLNAGIQYVVRGAEQELIDRREKVLKLIEKNQAK